MGGKRAPPASICVKLQSLEGDVKSPDPHPPTPIRLLTLLASVWAALFPGISSLVVAQRNPLPPQIFNDQDYCGDYDGFDVSNETDQLYVFLKLSDGEVNTAKDILTQKRLSTSREVSAGDNEQENPEKEDD